MKHIHRRGQLPRNEVLSKAASRIGKVSVTLLWLSGVCSLRAQDTTTADPFVKSGSTQAGGSGSTANGAYFNLVVEVYSIKMEETGDPKKQQYSYDQIRELERSGKASLVKLTSILMENNRKELIRSANRIECAPAADNRKLAKSGLPIASESVMAGDTLECAWSLKSSYAPGNTNVLNIFVESSRLADPVNKSTVAVASADPPPLEVMSLGTNVGLTLGVPSFMGAAASSRKAGETWFFYAKVTPLPEIAKDREKKTYTEDITVECSFYSMKRELAREALSKAGESEGSFNYVQKLLQEGKARRDRVIGMTSFFGKRMRVEDDYGMELMALVDEPNQNGMGICSLSLREKKQLNAMPYLTAEPVFEVKELVAEVCPIFGKHILLSTFNPPPANGIDENSDRDSTSIIFLRLLTGPF